MISNNIINNSDRTYLYGFSIYYLISLLYFIIVIWANTDFCEGGYCLFMDERITFNGVKQILHSTGFIDLMSNIVGGDHRYGRILSYSSAAAAFFPELISGEKGQIIAVRMFHASILYASYCVLVFSFIKSWLFRNIGLIILIAIPSTSYYSGMPKPEPLQLLFLSIFLYYASKKDYSFGFHWVFLGLSFGSKISVIPLASLWFIALFVYKYRKMNDKKPLLKSAFITSLYFILGWFIAEPLPLQSILTLNPNKFSIYLNSTFRNTTPGSDNPQVTFFTWLNYIFSDYFSIPFMLWLFIIPLFIILYFKSIKSYIHDIDRPKIISGWIFAVASIVLILPILFTTKRLWGFYLLNGIVLGCMSIIILSESAVASFQEIRKNKRLRALSIFLSALFATGLSFQLWASFSYWSVLANRSTSQKHIELQNQYNYMNELIDDVAFNCDHKIRVCLDPNLYTIPDSDLTSVSIVYGPFLSWNKEYDIIFFCKQKIPSIRIASKECFDIEPWIKADLLYKKYVISNVNNEIDKADTLCQYYEFKQFNNTLYILIRKDVFRSTEKTISSKNSFSP